LQLVVLAPSAIDRPPVRGSSSAAPPSAAALMPRNLGIAKLLPHDVARVEDLDIVDLTISAQVRHEVGIDATPEGRPVELLIACHHLRV